VFVRKTSTLIQTDALTLVLVMMLLEIRTSTNAKTSQLQDASPWAENNNSAGEKILHHYHQSKVIHTLHNRWVTTNSPDSLYSSKKSPESPYEGARSPSAILGYIP
jgi:hypothetical protein